MMSWARFWAGPDVWVNVFGKFLGDIHGMYRTNIDGTIRIAFPA